MTPERLAEINALAKGDPWVIGQELVKIIGEQDGEIKRLNPQLAEHEDADNSTPPPTLDQMYQRATEIAHDFLSRDTPITAATDYAIHGMWPETAHLTRRQFVEYVWRVGEEARRLAYLAGTTQTITTATKETVSE